MAVLTAVDMGARTFIILIPGAADSDSFAVRAAAANVMVKVGGLDPPVLDASGQLQSSHMQSPSAASHLPMRASPYETGLCVDKGSAGSSAGLTLLTL
jgi:hypothetical protein